MFKKTTNLLFVLALSLSISACVSLDAFKDKDNFTASEPESFEGRSANGIKCNSLNSPCKGYTSKGSYTEKLPGGYTAKVNLSAMKAEKIFLMTSWNDTNVGEVFKAEVTIYDPQGNAVPPHSGVNNDGNAAVFNTMSADDLRKAVDAYLAGFKPPSSSAPAAANSPTTSKNWLSQNQSLRDAISAPVAVSVEDNNEDPGFTNSYDDPEEDGSNYDDEAANDDSSSTTGAAEKSGMDRLTATQKKLLSHGSSLGYPGAKSIPNSITEQNVDDQVNQMQNSIMDNAVAVEPAAEPM